ncbi:hypothetical protein ES707_19443 [subsurface metagenome]
MNRKRIYDILEITNRKDKATKIFSISITSLIFINVGGIILGTVEKFSCYRILLRTIEVFPVIVFTVEYIVRLWACTADKKFRSPVIGRMRFAITPMAIIDFIAIFPFYLPMVFRHELRAVRISRVFRFLKLGRYSASFKLFVKILRKKREELLMTGSVILIVLIVSSCLMYVAENKAQPELFSSIPDAMWWSVITLTTVGYGDLQPVTGSGKFLGAIIALMGIGVLALPTGILASGFVEEIQKRRDKKRVCPHCGKPLEKG